MTDEDVGTDRDIPEGSPARHILEAGEIPECARRRARRRLENPSPPDPEGPAGVVLDRPPATWTAAAAGGICAVILHGGLLAAASIALQDETDPVSRTEPPDPLEVEHVVQLDRKPTPDEPKPKPEPKKKPAPTEAADKTETADRDPAPRDPPEEPAETPSQPEQSPQKKGAAARAGEVVDAESGSGVVDFTVGSGDGESFAGGVTAPSGSSDDPVEAGSPVGRPGKEESSTDSGGDRRPVGLDRTSWDCRWPEKAEDLSTDEQVVVLRAVVRPDGTPKSVTIVSDPGFGFGQAALECARSHEFRPALNDDGEPRTATSPPIRVRFTR